MAPTTRTTSRTGDRTRTASRFPWHALTVAVAAVATAVGAVAPQLLDLPDAVAGPARDAAYLVLVVAVSLVAVATVAAEVHPADGLPILRDIAFLAAVVALSTLADPGVRPLVLVIAVVGMFAWGAPGDREP